MIKPCLKPVGHMTNYLRKCKRCGKIWKAPTKFTRICPDCVKPKYMEQFKKATGSV